MKPITILASLVAALTVGSASSKEFFASPSGAGDKSGAAWESALPKEEIERAFNELLKPGDALLLDGGDYGALVLTLSRGGDEKQPKTFAGVDRGAGLPQFSADWSIDKPQQGLTAIRLAPGLSHAAFKNLKIRSYRMAITTPDDDATAHKNLSFENIAMGHVEHGYYFFDCDNVSLTNCSIIKYAKHGFRFEYGCNGVTVKNCIADCTEGDTVWESKTEVFPFGFNVNDKGAPSTDIVFSDCAALNNRKSNQQNKYPNGDGFVIEGSAERVKLERCRAINNQDGGFDLKPADLVLTDCVAVGNKRGFRIWKSATLTNCCAAFSSEGEIWTKGKVVAEGCTFHATKRVTDIEAEGASLTARRCIFSGPGLAKAVTLEESHVYNGKDGPPDFADPKPDWNGVGSNFDSKAFPEKGYSSTRIKR